MARKIVNWSALVLSVVTGLLSLCAWLYSSLSIVPGDLLDDNPLSSPFTLTNTSGFSIKSVDPSCLLKNVKFQGGIHVMNDQVVDHTPKSPRLESGEQESIYCQRAREVAEGPIKYGDIVIDVGYSPAWAPYKVGKIHHPDGWQREDAMDSVRTKKRRSSL